MKLRAVSVLFLAMAAIFVPATHFGAVHAATSTTDQAVAYQENVAHTGAVSGDPMNVPSLVRRWSVNLGGSVSYPLIAGGRVFVTVANPAQGGTTLYALDESTGATIWTQTIRASTGGINYPWSNAAYDNGTVFVQDYAGDLRAFDAATGTLKWTDSLPGEYAFSSPPVADSGQVFTGGAGSGGLVYGVSEADGTPLWAPQQVMNGDHSSPALSGTNLYVSYACAQTYSFSRAGGSSVWHSYAPTNCEGGGGKTPVLANGSLYVRDFWCGGVNFSGGSNGGCNFDVTGGTLTGSFTAGPAPAISGTTGLFLANGTLTAQNVSAGSTLWTFVSPNASATLVTAPIVVNGDVIVGDSAGAVYALDLGSGQTVWNGSAGAAILAPDEQNVSQPLTGLGAGEGYLVVPAGSTLTAFANPPATVTAASFSATEGTAFSGTVGSFTDSSASAAGDTASISWGDGSSSAATVTAAGGSTFSVSGSHTYTEDGTYAVTVTVTNSWGSASAGGTATVADAVLASTGGFSLSGTAAASVTGATATFQDSNPACPLSDFSASVSWGDGTAPSAASVAAGSGSCTFTASGSHTYAVPGTYTVTTTMGDAGGSKTSASSTAVIGTPPPTFRASVSASNNSGGYSISLSASTKNGNSSGSLQYQSPTVKITSSKITSIVKTGPNNATVYGSGTQNGAPVTFAVSLLGNQSTGSNTFAIQTNTGYSSGTLKISTAKVS